MSSSQINTPEVPTGTVSVTDFGAVGDGRTDDSRAIQAAIDSLVSTQVHPSGWSHVGGVVEFPRGQFVVRSPIRITVPGITLQGCGLPSSQRSCALVSAMEGPVLLFPEDGAKPTPFAMRNISIHGNKIVGGQYVVVPKSRGIEIHSDGPGGFRRKFILENVGIFCMDAGILITRHPTNDKMAQIGEMRLRDCIIGQNRVGIQFENSTSCNLMTISDSTISQNAELGADIRAYAFTCTGSCFEGQPNGLRFRGAGAVIAGCHSEFNDGYAIDADGREVVGHGNYYYYPPGYAGLRDKFRFTNKK